jgi:hypothetical protein
MWFRIFTSALVAGVSWALGGLTVWLLGELKLPPELQAHHPFAQPVSGLFQQTASLFLGALAVYGAMAGFLLPARRYGMRKLAELEATARTLAVLWGLVAGVILLAAVFESASIWPFVLLSAIAGAFSLLAAAALRVALRAAGRRAVPEPSASDLAPLHTARGVDAPARDCDARLGVGPGLG